MPEPLLVERNGSIETWRINLPEIRNPITSPEMIEAFVANTARVDRDPDVKCVILTGEGSAFSAGGNLRELAEKKGMFGGPPYVQRNGYRHGVQRIPLALHDCEVPIIAAVNGPAVGAGCDLAVMADIRIASETAIFAEAFVQLGLIPGDGGAWFLTQTIGRARAAEMALTGDRVDAATALEWGLVSRVVPPEKLLDEATALAERIVKNSGPAVRMAKKLLRESRRRDLADVLELSAAMQALAHFTDEHENYMEEVRHR
ncbi:crotonase/enoyl-CoA hydratase family protein [Mycobacterium sp. NAZ190054]|uniref:crotonase/enoyl-CoA hydratase family protein n=1 Tax=Mycobacterium sp. NAZ190054 TaxID=1747766 RepID=UPI000795F1EC|nr:crotonase/enoyl-CoA hydratase family protein [Mycobacterium sp. NAZ190054]KWX56499.1 enoyl-CoA hydratase [Mycobacterium sp. NAZ190054]